MLQNYGTIYFYEIVEHLQNMEHVLFGFEGKHNVIFILAKQTDRHKYYVCLSILAKQVIINIV